MLSYSEMVVLCREAVTELAGAKVLYIAGIDKQKWSVALQRDGVKKELLISAHYPFNRFHLSSVRLTTGSTPFTRALNEKLVDGILIGMQLLGEDRVLDLHIEKEGQELHFVVELCMRHPRVLLMDGSWKILISYEALADTHYRLPKKERAHDEQEASCTSAEIEKKYAELEERQAFAERVRHVRAQLKTRLKKAKGRVERHQEDLNMGKQWEKQAHLAELLKSHFFLVKRGMSEIEVEDWEEGGKKVTLPLDPALEPQEQLKSQFKLSRKLKKRFELAEGLIAEAKKQMDGFTILLEELDTVCDLPGLVAFEKKAGVQQPSSLSLKKRVEKTHPFREFTTEAGRKIFIGKKDEDNDKLTFSFAQGLDLWFHAANTAGSHVILRVSKGEKVDESSVQDALQLALYFSKARSRQEDEVVMTECKYVSKSRRDKPGQVNVSKHKTVRVRSDPQRLQRLLGKWA